MILFPAIDILGGKSVRLFKGEFDKVTVYGEPQQMAEKFKAEGARWLHVVDLDGAKNGVQGNLEIIRNICQTVKINVQLGGGIRTLQDIELRLGDVGVARVILGTACLDTELVKNAVKKYGSERVICGLDARDGKLAIKGWTESSAHSPIEFAKIMKDCGIEYVVYTDISRDGALTGINSAACLEMAQKSGLKVIASGGLNSLNDIKILKQNNIYGAILGKAVYENVFTVAQAVKLI